jgi:hypothetical protein
MTGRRSGKVDEVDVPEHTHDIDHKHKSRRGRRLLFLLALAGGVFVALKRRQQQDDLDEGVWHEAPTA